MLDLLGTQCMWWCSLRVREGKVMIEWWHGARAGAFMYRACSLLMVGTCSGAT